MEQRNITHVTRPSWVTWAPPASHDLTSQINNSIQREYSVRFIFSQITTFIVTWLHALSSENSYFVTQNLLNCSFPNQIPLAINTACYSYLFYCSFSIIKYNGLLDINAYIFCIKNILIYISDYNIDWQS
jgi:hypothetical protein